MFCAATGELIVVNYLFSQTGKVLEDIADDPDVPDIPEVEEEEEDDQEGDDDDDDDGGFQELLFDTEFLSDSPQPDQQPAASASQSDTPQDEERQVNYRFTVLQLHHCQFQNHMTNDCFDLPSAAAVLWPRRRSRLSACVEPC